MLWVAPFMLSPSRLLFFHFNILFLAFKTIVLNLLFILLFTWKYFFYSSGFLVLFLGLGSLFFYFPCNCHLFLVLVLHTCSSCCTYTFLWRFPLSLPPVLPTSNWRHSYTYCAPLATPPSHQNRAYNNILVPCLSLFGPLTTKAVLTQGDKGGCFSLP